MLLDRGVDHLIVSSNGQRVSDIAARSGSCVMQEIVESLWGKGARGEKKVKNLSVTPQQSRQLDLLGREMNILR